MKWISFLCSFLLLVFSFLKDRIDENVAVFLLVVGERAKGFGLKIAACSSISIVCMD